MVSYRFSDSKGHLVQSDRAPYVWIQILCAFQTICQLVQAADNSCELMSHLLYMRCSDG